MEKCEWAKIDGGFSDPKLPQGSLDFNEYIGSQFNNSKDNVGIKLEVKNGELLFIHSKTSVGIQSELTLIRALVRAKSSKLQIFVGVFEGDLSSGEFLDGSSNFSTKTSSEEFLDNEGYIYAIIHTQKKLITPFIQVFNSDTNSNNGESTNGETSVLLLDRIDVIEITDHWELNK